MVGDPPPLPCGCLGLSSWMVSFLSVPSLSISEDCLPTLLSNKTPTVRNSSLHVGGNRIGVDCRVWAAMCLNLNPIFFIDRSPPWVCTWPPSFSPLYTEPPQLARCEAHTKNSEAQGSCARVSYTFLPCRDCVSPIQSHSHQPKTTFCFHFSPNVVNYVCRHRHCQPSYYLL